MTRRALTGLSGTAAGYVTALLAVPQELGLDVGRGRRLGSRRARKAAGAPHPERRPAAFELGRHVDGDRLLPTRRGRVQMPLGRLEKTLLVIGAPGLGKAETLLRLAHGVAHESDWCVFVIDAKGDPQHPTTLRRGHAGSRPPGPVVPE